MEKDRIKWNKKYSQNQELLKRENISSIVKKYAPLAPIKKALDIACGNGRHIRYLVNLGFDVDGIDISDIALKEVANNIDFLKVRLIEIDLANFKFEKNCYSLILKINFLDREVIKKAKKALKKNGIFIIEGYLEDSNNEKKNSNKNYLLKKDELKSFFDKDFKIIKYLEFNSENYEKYRMKKAAIVARKK